MSTLNSPILVWKHILNCAFFLLAVLCSIPEVNAEESKSICDRAAETNEGLPYFETMTLTAKNGSSLLLKQTCPLQQSYLEVSVYDQKSKALLQEFRIDEESDFFTPETKDVNLDGYPDLMFVVLGGDVNSCHSIWFYDPPRRRFHKVLIPGEYDACFTDFFKDKQGYFVTGGRTSCCSWAYHFYLLRNWKLKPKFGISVGFDPQNEKVRCEMWPLPFVENQKSKPVRDKYLRETYCSHYDEKDGKKRNDH